MALEKIEKVSGRGVVVGGDDLDTDRIIPARFLKCVTFDGLAEGLFYDVRFDSNGKADPSHGLNDPRFVGATVMIAGRNFGCGSSREHAPQAIAKAGFKAVVAENFAEIFFGNSTTLGIPCVSLRGDDLRRLSDLVRSAPETEITIDLASGRLSAGEDLSFEFSIKPAAGSALREGQWDPITQLLSTQDRVDEVAAALPYI